jgi:hypothetical protein
MTKKRTSAHATAKAPRGGETTITKGGMRRKTMYFDDAEWQAIRRQAFEETGNTPTSCARPCGER